MSLSCTLSHDAEFCAADDFFIVAQERCCRPAGSLRVSRHQFVVFRIAAVVILTEAEIPLVLEKGIDPALIRDL